MDHPVYIINNLREGSDFCKNHDLGRETGKLGLLSQSTARMSNHGLKHGQRCSGGVVSKYG